MNACSCDCHTASGPLPPLIETSVTSLSTCCGSDHPQRHQRGQLFVIMQSKYNLCGKKVRVISGRTRDKWSKNTSSINRQGNHDHQPPRARVDPEANEASDANNQGMSLPPHTGSVHFLHCVDPEPLSLGVFQHLASYLLSPSRILPPSQALSTLAKKPSKKNMMNHVRESRETKAWSNNRGKLLTK